MDRDEQLKLVKRHVRTKNLIKHMKAVEAVMGALARHLGEDEPAWRTAGLLHDMDYDQTLDDPARHGLVSAEILRETGLAPEIVHAIQAHNDVLGVVRETMMDKALYAADPITGLIVAAALIHPDKSLAAIDASFVLKRFDEKHFARGADRAQIRACLELGLSLEQFVDISVRAMQDASAELGL